MIRLCSQSEALEILNEPQTIERLGLISEKVFSPWIVSEGDHKLMFVFWIVSEGEYEMHIACPKKSIIKSRFLAKKAMDFVFSLGAKKIITDCPKGKISNMAIKLGMSEYKRVGDKVYFEVSYGCWCSNNR